MNKKTNPVLIIVFVVLYISGVTTFVIWASLSKEERSLEIYDQQQTLSHFARRDAKVYAQTEYEVREFSDENTNLDRVLFPVKENYRSIIPLTPCTDEQSALKIGDIIRFEYSENSLDEQQPNALNLLCYWAIKR